MRNVGPTMTKEVTPMFNHEIARIVTTERIRDAEWRIRHRPAPRAPNRIRRTFGHGVIRIGEVIAAEARLRPTT